MSDQMLASLLTLGFFALLGAWVPVLDFLKERSARAERSTAPRATAEPQRVLIRRP